MKVAFVAAVLLAFATLALAQHHCETPSVWEGRHWRRDPKFNFTDHQFMHYDRFNRKIATIDEIFESVRKRDFFWNIMLFDQKTRYEINLKTKECKRHELNEPFRPFEIPHDAHFVDDLDLGTDAFPGGGVEVSVFDIDALKTKGFFWQGVVTKVACIPVRDLMYDSKIKNFYESHFFDITLGISNPNVFVPPAECHQA